MGIGTAKKQIDYPKPPPSAFSDAKLALQNIGAIKEADESAFFLRGSTTYGLQIVRMKVTVAPNGGGSTMTIKALADDIWGKGARKGCDRFLEELGGIGG